jgi:hypothetical protein
MQLLDIIVFFAGLAVAAPTLAERDGDHPSGHEVEIRGFTYGGTGCPQGSLSSQISDDKTVLTLLYDKFTAQAGKNIQPVERRKNCQVNVKIHFPQGWQFSIVKADFRGYADIPKGASGTCKATYYFSGHTQQITSTKTFQGPFTDNYLKSDVFGVESTIWSECGADSMLNINSQIQLNPLDSQQSALLTSDSTDLKFKQIHYLQWRKCTK